MVSWLQSRRHARINESGTMMKWSRGDWIAAVCLVGALSALIGIGIWSLRAEKQCRQDCRPLASKLIDDECYCSSHDGWQRL